MDNSVRAVSRLTEDHRIVVSRGRWYGFAIRDGNPVSPLAPRIVESLKPVRIASVTDRMERDMLGLGRLLFGRSREIQRLDEAFSAAGLTPAAVPDSAKIATVNLLKSGLDVSSPNDDQCATAAILIAYCTLGVEAFSGKHGRDLTAELDHRVTDAILAGDSLDAQLIMLTIHSGMTHGEIIEEYQLSAGD